MPSPVTSTSPTAMSSPSGPRRAPSSSRREREQSGDREQRPPQRRFQSHVGRSDARHDRVPRGRSPSRPLELQGGGGAGGDPGQKAQHERDSEDGAHSAGTPGVHADSTNSGATI
jgi:hypothetical protein